METTLLHTTCPCCFHTFAAGDLDVDFYLPGEMALECPACEWAFAVDLDGQVVDAGGLDSEAPFEVDDEGELVVQECVTVCCPHCARVQQVEESGLTRCRHCRCMLHVEDDGSADEALPLQEDDWQQE
jgi:hypothetical protein